jgi:hypothetical protein
MRITKFAALGVLLQCLVWSAADAQSLQKIRVGYPSISSRQAQLWLAQDQGIFRKHGLDVELIFLRGGAGCDPGAHQRRSADRDRRSNSYQHYLKRTPKKPYPTMKGIQNLIDMSAPQIPRAKSAKPEQFVDLSLLQELEAEKFFDDMARRYK